MREDGEAPMNARHTPLCLLDTPPSPPPTTPRPPDIPTVLLPFISSQEALFPFKPDVPRAYAAAAAEDDAELFPRALRLWVARAT
jgi:hypothetical protein